MKARLGLSIALVVIILLLGANVYIWRIQGGVYEYSIGVYFAGLMTPVGIVGALMLASKHMSEEEE